MLKNYKPRIKLHIYKRLVTQASLKYPASSTMLFLSWFTKPQARNKQKTERIKGRSHDTIKF